MARLGHIIDNPLWTDLANPFCPETKVAIVYKKEDGRAAIAPVKPADSSTRCYDKGGSKEQCHEHNVSLKDFESIYKGLLDDTPYGYYAIANTFKPCMIDDDFLAEQYVTIVPNTGPMPDGIIGQLRDHPWRDELQKAKPVRYGFPSTPSAKGSPDKDGPELP